MALPEPVERLWRDLESVRAEVLREADGLSQAQADWKPGEKDWSVGEIVHHLTIAEVATGKLTTKLTREAEAAGALKPFPADLRELRGIAIDSASRAEAPPVVWPEAGKPIATLVADMKATRERSRQSIEKLGTVDPRPLVFKHFALGDLDLAQWWQLQANHDATHLRQIRAVKAAPGFPKA
ncbi:MAG: DinB family protein [Candidatus Rokubacteria bacterium]|nr:DinB family protein [Candidatus Rokubacteria bacterium]